MPSRKNKKDLLEKRRSDVALLYKAGYSQRRIANELKIALGTVNKDITLFRKLWRENQVEVEDVFYLDVQRLDDALSAIASMVLKGNLKAIDRWIRIMERRAKMFGYDAPTKTHTDVDIKAANQIKYVEIVPPDLLSNDD